MPGYQPVFRMKNLPKAEYLLMKALIEQFALDDPSELFTCLLRVGYELLYMHSTTIADGGQYLTRIIAEYRSNPKEQRQYELPTVRA